MFLKRYTSKKLFASKPHQVYFATIIGDILFSNNLLSEDKRKYK